MTASAKGMIQRWALNILGSLIVLSIAGGAAALVAHSTAIAGNTIKVEAVVKKTEALDTEIKALRAVYRDNQEKILEKIEGLR